MGGGLRRKKRLRNESQATLTLYSPHLADKVRFFLLEGLQDEGFGAAAAAAGIDVPNQTIASLMV